MRRRGAAAAANDIEPALLRKVAQVCRHDVRRLVEPAEGVGQTGVGIATAVDRRDLGQFLHVRAHLLGAQCAIDPDAQQWHVRDGIPEGLDRLAGERAPTAIRDRHRYHERHAPLVLLEILVNGEQRRLQVQGVEYCLAQQHIHPAVHQPAHLLGIGGHQVVVGHRAEGRIVHVRRHRGGAVGRPDCTGDEARPRWVRCGHLLRSLARDARAGEIQVVHDVLELVVRHRDRRGVERVGLDDVGAGLEILNVDLLDERRLSEDQEIVAPLKVARMMGELAAAEAGLVELVRLDHGPHRAVKDRDAVPENVLERHRAACFELSLCARNPAIIGLALPSADYTGWSLSAQPSP